MNPIALAGLALMLVAMPAHARDERLASRPYSSDEIVRIDGRAGVQASIILAEEEHIENVAIGDSNSWQVTPNRRANILFVKPLAPDARTNLTVVTDKRSYFFDLVASPKARPLYALRFEYPKEPAAARAMDSRASLSTGRPPPSAPLNFSWKTKGKRNLLPARIYDDGVSTFVTWPADAPIPAILARNEKGEEGPVNFAVRADVIVIDGVPGLLVLRAGKDSATLERAAPAARQRRDARLSAKTDQ